MLIFTSKGIFCISKTFQNFQNFGFFFQKSPNFDQHGFYFFMWATQWAMQSSKIYSFFIDNADQLRPLNTKTVWWDSGWHFRLFLSFVEKCAQIFSIISIHEWNAMESILIWKWFPNELLITHLKNSEMTQKSKAAAAAGACGQR